MARILPRTARGKAFLNRPVPVIESAQCSHRRSRIGSLISGIEGVKTVKLRDTQGRLEAGATKGHRYIGGAIRSRGYLPHRETEHPIYFVTFRLADSLPRELMARFRTEREAGKKTATDTAGADRARLCQLRALLRRAERCLDSGLGECHMRDSRIAKIVADAIQHFHGKRYELLAWCVMPNHVHVVFSPLGENSLEVILHSWKSFSALKANRLLGRHGHFWQREYFDHLVRSDVSLLKIIRYVKENPRRAGLRNWAWVGAIS
jgi:REP element-mobilizing transposase RayT